MREDVRDSQMGEGGHAGFPEGWGRTYGIPRRVREHLLDSQMDGGGHMGFPDG